jgi:hypothetical protein
MAGKLAGNANFGHKDERIIEMFTHGPLRFGMVILGCAALMAVLGGCPRNNPPTVSSTVPADGATGVPVNSNLSATFSEAMDPATITAATFTLMRGSTPVPGVVSYAGVTATFNPTSALAPNTLYTARISAAAAALSKSGIDAPYRDQCAHCPDRRLGFPALLLGIFIAGSLHPPQGDGTLAEDYVWTFTTGAAADSTAPMVTFTVPANGDTGVPLGGNFAVTFSEAMDPLTITAQTLTLSRGNTPVAGAVSYGGVTAMFNPTSTLAPNTVYTAAVWMEAADLAGNTLADDFVWTFTTGATTDVTAPMVSSVVPVNRATGVPLSRNLAAIFSEAMDPLTINTATFTLQQGTAPVAGTVTYAGVTAIFNPLNALAPNTAYTATIWMEAQDLAGNAGEEDFVWNFTTGAAPDTTAPTVSSVIPANGSTGVLLGRNLAATFSEAMNPLTINTLTFTLRRGSTPVSGTVSYAGVTATFNPSSALVPNTVYTATITGGAEDLAGNALASNRVWSFTTGAAPDTTAPTVSFTVPANGSSGVLLGRNLSATFSEAMNPLTITTLTFTLRRGVIPISGIVTYAGLTATFHPLNALAPNTAYTATITTGARDLAGNAIASNRVWSFTTGAVPDTTPPKVTSTAPLGGSVDGPLGRNLTATFSEPMDPLTITAATFTLRQGGTLIPGAVSYAGVTAIFNPASTLAPNTLFTATITAEAADLAGNTQGTNYMWTFTTGAIPDTTAPLVSSTVPAEGSAGVLLGRNLSATFSEAMDPLTISTETFTLAQGTAPVDGTVSYAGVTATFNPLSALAPDTEYTATIWREATDLAGNPLAEDFVWTFTTSAAADTTAPTVLSTDPADGATGVPVNKSLAAIFSEAMDPLTISTETFTLTQGTTPVDGAVTYAGVTATFNPLSALAPNTTYTATVWMEAADLAGNAGASDQVWSFTTGAGADSTAPMVNSTDPADEAAGVPVNKNIAATFSEAMDPLTISTATFTLARGTTPVSGTVTYAGVTATFNPSTNLAANTSYTATVWMEAQDLAGNAGASDYAWTFTTGVTTSQDSIDLGSANAFAILAGSTVSNTGPTIVTGDLGVSPGTAVVGFPPGTLNGAMFSGVASAAGQAKLDLTAAFNEAAGRSVGPVSLPGNLSGLTLYPGLYTNSTSVMLSVGNVTLDAQGDSNAVFLFQMGSTLTTGSSTQVVLSGGAKAANIYWQVGTSATLGTTSIFKGNILAQESITLATGATLEGRALTQTAAVTLDAAVITVPAP